MIDKPDPDEQRLQDAVDALAEHYDSLIIFATRYESEAESGEQGTVGITRRRGNYYASCGLVRGWVKQQDEHERSREKE